MLQLLLTFNRWKGLLPGAVLAASSVPYYVGVMGWYTISRILPKRYFALIDDIMYSGYQRMMLFVFENISGVTLKLYGDIDDERVRRSQECVIYISNHQSTMDWAVAEMLAIRQGSLGHVRFVLKDTLRYMPLYGFYFYVHGCVYVRRSGQFQKDASNKQLQYIANLEQPTWLVIFPEGTRYNPEKPNVIEQSRRYAAEIGVQPLDYVLMPRSRGFEMAITSLRHRLDAVYDVTIAYDQAIDRTTTKIRKGPSMLEFVCSEPRTELHVHLKRIPINEIPSEPKAIREWLYGRFQQKDKYLKEFYRKKIAKGTDDGNAFPDLKNSDSCLPWTSTLPPVLLIAGCGSLPFILFPYGRKAYCLVVILGTLFGMGYLKVNKAT